MKASPGIRTFNGGEVSDLMAGRTDIDRYPSTQRTMLNAVATPQGPFVCRSGGQFMGPIRDEAKRSYLVPFVFSETDLLMIEFADQRIRFLTEDGLLVKAAGSMNITDDSPFEFTSSALNADGATVGDQVAFSDLPEDYNLNGVVGTITYHSGTTFRVDTVFPAGKSLIGTGKVALVYSVESPYDFNHTEKIVELQSLDVLYLWHPEVPTYKLKRLDTYNWQFEKVTWVDGPYLPTNEESTTLTPSATGKHTPNMTANNLPSGSVALASSETAGYEAYKVFDDPALDTFWKATTDQAATVQYRATGAPFICTGYSLSVALDNADTSYTSKDMAPSTFTFEGSNDGSNWTVLDKQNNYVLYDNNKSVLFEIDNNTAYEYYRLNVKSLTRNGPNDVRLRSLVMRSTTSVANINITASSVSGVNNGQGFLATDVGRLIRMRGTDGFWRSLVITARTSSTVVVATLLGEPFPDLQPTSKWRLGLWSDTTGYPNCGVFYQDRLWAGGSTSYPDAIAFSVTGSYDVMSPTSPSGEVLDTNGASFRLNARRMSRIRWLAEGRKGLLIGTGSGEAQLTPLEGSGKTITPNSIFVDFSSRRGSADVPPAAIDQQVLYVQRGGRTIREYAYNYEADGYKSPSMSQLASHIGVKPFERLAYAAEPYSIVWALRSDGTVVGLTYNRDESVIGWHRHQFPDIGDTDAVIESLAVLPSTNQLQDALWIIARRTVNGATRRYIEKLTPFWDFDMTVGDAHYVDCGLRYEGAPTRIVYGLTHLEGREVYGVADGVPFGPLTVTGGKITLLQAASNVVIGIGFESLVVTQRLENGGETGTAQGKIKRFDNGVLLVWDSYGGEVGTRNEETDEVMWEPLVDQYPGQDVSALQDTVLYTGLTRQFPVPVGYGKDGCIYIRRRKDVPLPLNVAAILPTMVTNG